MSKDLVQVHSRLLKTIQANFSKPLDIEGQIYSVNIDNKSFVMTKEDGDKYLECYYKDDISFLQKGVMVKVRAWVRLHPNKTGNIFLAVEHIHVLSQDRNNISNLDMHYILAQTLTDVRCQKLIDKIRSNKMPKKIFNVALITLSCSRSSRSHLETKSDNKSSSSPILEPLVDNEQNIENFKTIYQEKCVGKLFIYRLKYQNLSSSLKIACEYFKKYHNIDLICLLLNQVTLNEICALSSKDNVKYMLNRKNVPYIISIIAPNNKLEALPECDDIDQSVKPMTLSAVLSNKIIAGIVPCINLICSKQIPIKKKIMDAIQLGKNRLQHIIEDYQQKVLELSLCIASLNDPRFINISKINEQKFEKLKYYLLRRLDKEKIILGNISIYMMKSIIYYPQMDRMYKTIIESENKNANYEKIENKKPDNNLNDKLGIIIRQEDGDL